MTVLIGNQSVNRMEQNKGESARKSASWVCQHLRPSAPLQELLFQFYHGLNIVGNR
jgi:hypothetical protein